MGWKVGREERWEDLGGLQVGDAVIKICYGRKNLFSIKEKEKAGERHKNNGCKKIHINK